MQQISLGTKEPRRMFPQSSWIEGLSDYNKIGGAYLWARGVDYRTEPSQLSLLPQALPEGSGIFTDLGKFGEQVVGRTVNIGAAPNLIANGSFETNTTGWTLGADYTRANDDAFIGSWSIKQVSTTGNATFTTASGSGLAVTAYADYQLIFRAKVVAGGALPRLTILGGSLAGPNLLAAPYTIVDTNGSWVEISLSFNALQYTSVFIVITNQGGAVTAHYDLFSLNQINSIATYVIGNQGNLYKRYSNATWVTLGQLPNSHGNGLGYYGEDDYLYMTGDKTLGRYGPISSGVPTLVNDYLQSAGGIPTNTNSALLVAASSQYFAKSSPSTALTTISTALGIEAFVKPTSLPAVGSSMTVASLWNENTNKRAYILDILGISGYFGDGSSSSLTINVDTVEAPIDSACSGIIDTTTLFATNASFAVGQKILIIQMMGPNAGLWQITTIQGYTAGQITTQDPLIIGYSSSNPSAAQVRVLPQYTSVIVNGGVTYSPKPWNGATGGILAFLANGTITVTGTISANGTNSGNSTSWPGGGASQITAAGMTGGGFRGGNSYGYNTNPAGPTGQCGEGTGGPRANQTANNGNGGGGGGQNIGGNSAGGGGANGTGGGNATFSGGTNATGGVTAGTTDLTAMVMGGGGGGSSFYAAGGNTIQGAPSGGGIVFINAPSVVVTGAITANGGHATNTGNLAGMSGAAAGSILVKGQTCVLGSGLIQAVGGVGGFGIGGSSIGGDGGDGRVAVYYLTSLAGTTTPSAFTLQDNTLVTSVSYQARLGLSDNGTSFEYLTQNLKNIGIGNWDRLQVSWDGVSKTAFFFESGTLIGQAVGTKTAIYTASTADFIVGANVIAGGAHANYLDAEVNDVRVWATNPSAAQFAQYNEVNLGGVFAGLAGSWFLSNTGNDQTTAANNLIGSGSPTYVTDVPYPGATTRGDLDQIGAGTGFDYDLPTSLTENQFRTFVPAYDPQKSLQININAKGTGDWTLVIHDGLNNNVMTMTVVNANLPASGLYEFAFPQTYRPVKGATYHFHLYSTVGDGSVVSGADDDPTTMQFNTYYQFLVNDTEYHPIMQTGNLLSIANERYVAVLSAAGGDGIGTYNGQGYNPHRLSFPAGWRVRCMALWRGYYAFGCWRGTSIKDFDQGIVFIWDGFSPTYNDFFFVPQGGVNAMWGENGILYLIAGYQGDLLEYTGDLMAEYGYDIVNKAKRIPKLGVGNQMEVAPGAIVYYDSLLRIGVAYTSTGDTLERGVYTWGSRQSIYPKSLSYDVPISTGNRGSSVSMGLLLPVNGDLLMFYQDGNAYGVNNYAPTNPPQATGTIEALIFDANAVYHPKELLTVRANHFPLDLGANVDVKYKIDYEDSWHNLGITKQLVGANTTRLPLPATDGTQEGTNEYHALQIGIDLYASQGISPRLIETGNFTDLLTTEGDEVDA